MLVNIHLFDAKIHQSVSIATFPPSLSQFTAQLVALLQPLSGLSKSSNDSMNNETVASRTVAESDQLSTKTMSNNKSSVNETLGRLLEKFNIRDKSDDALLDPRIKRVLQEVVTNQSDLSEDAFESPAGLLLLFLIVINRKNINCYFIFIMLNYFIFSKFSFL